jgi:sporulation protein YlmC with PRC-barrel domain
MKENKYYVSQKNKKNKDNMKNKKRDLLGKTVMSREGSIIGKIKDIQDKTNKENETILVKPEDKINLKTYKLNKKGDIILPSKCITRVRNITILENLKPLLKR